jgi:hypothetical protein
MARKGLIQLPGFEGVDAGGGSYHIPEGDYTMRCTSCTQAVSKASDNPMLVFTFTGMEGKSKNKKFWLYCALVPDAYWKLKQTLEALQVETPDDPSELDPESVVDVDVIGTVVDNEYEGKTNSKLSFITASDAVSEDDEEEDEKPAAKSKKAPVTAKANGKSAKKLDKLAAAEVEEMDEEELDDVVERYSLDIDLSTQKTKRRKANAVIAALQAEKMLEA